MQINEWKEPKQIQRTKWTPQGWVISPVLANLFLHYALDKWMTLYYPAIPFERYADDCIYHCRTEAQAEKLRTEIINRLKKVWLELNLDKTKITYCKDGNRKGKYENEHFDFLWFTFMSRWARSIRWWLFTSFLPAVSNKAKKHIKQTIKSWKIYKKTGSSIEDIAKEINPTLNWWINYFGSYYKSELNDTLRYLNILLMRWARKKYKKYNRSYKKAWKLIQAISQREPTLFAHWNMYWTT